LTQIKPLKNNRNLTFIKNADRMQVAHGQQALYRPMLV